jgi:2-isopropylmalate synthase
VIRVNSQSGKGGVAFVLERDYGLNLPRWMQIELARLVQRESERRGGEMDAANIHRIFMDHFVVDRIPVRLVGYRLDRNGHDVIEARISGPDGERRLRGEGDGAMAAFVDAWSRWSGQPVRILDYQEHAIGEGTDAEAVAYVQLELGTQRIAGAAIDRDTVAASLGAVLSALNRGAVQAAQAA